MRLRSFLALGICLASSIAFGQADYPVDWSPLDPAFLSYDLVVSDHSTGNGSFTLSYDAGSSHSGYVVYQGGGWALACGSGYDWILKRGTSPESYTYTGIETMPPQSGAYLHYWGPTYGQYTLTLNIPIDCSEPNSPMPVTSPDGGAGFWAWDESLCDWIWSSNWNNENRPPDYPGGPGQGFWVFDTSGEESVWAWSGEPYPSTWAWSDSWPWTSSADNWPDLPPEIPDGQVEINNTTSDEDNESFEAESLEALRTLNETIQNEGVDTRQALNDVIGTGDAIDDIDENLIAALPDLTHLQAGDSSSFGVMENGVEIDPPGFIGTMRDRVYATAFFLQDPGTLGSDQTLSLTLPTAAYFQHDWNISATWPAAAATARGWIVNIMSLLLFLASVRLMFAVFGGGGTNS